MKLALSKRTKTTLAIIAVSALALTPQLAFAQNVAIDILADGAVSVIFRFIFIIAAVWTLMNLFSDFSGGANFGDVIKKGLAVAFLAGMAIKYQDILKMFKDM